MRLLNRCLVRAAWVEACDVLHSKLRRGDARIQKGDCFAKAHISTAQAPARQDARFPFAHEDRRRPQGACGASQEGPSSAHSRIARSAWIFRARRDWFGAESLTPYTVPGSAARIPTSPFFFARTNCRTAALDSASRRHSAAQ